jgi:hypothetical protein
LPARPGTKNDQKKIGWTGSAAAVIVGSIRILLSLYILTVTRK